MAGETKGRMPVGEAWLFAATALNRTPQILRYAWRRVSAAKVGNGAAFYTCHFKHAGLKDGAFLEAPPFVVKMCRTFASFVRGDR